MAFRADEAAQNGYEEVEAYFIPRTRDMDETERQRSKALLQSLAGELGPVVTAYPSWHPLVSSHDDHKPVTTPGVDCGFRGLDHTRYFAHGFITCPYGDGQEVIDSVEALPSHPAARITARRLDAQLFCPTATPIVVKCVWRKPLEKTGMIPLSLAMPLLLEKEVPSWRWSHAAETWEAMRPYLIGRPHGSRSSLFVSQETGQAMKNIWTDLINSGMFGRIYPFPQTT